MTFSLASKAFTFISYANDTTLFSTVSNFTNTPNTDTNCLINQEFFKINEWLEINKLSLNIAKTKYMLFHMICTTKKSIHLRPIYTRRYSCGIPRGIAHLSNQLTFIYFCVTPERYRAVSRWIASRAIFLRYTAGQPSS